MASAATNIAAMAARVPVRTRPTSARTWLPSQAYEDQENQSSRKSSRPRVRVTAEGSSSMNSTIRVSAKTNTRSKKISKLVVRCRSAVVSYRPRKMRTLPSSCAPAGTAGRFA